MTEYEYEKPKNEDKPKNEEVRAELNFWRTMAGLLGFIVVGGILIFFVFPHIFPPAVEIVKYCGDTPCKEQGVTLADSFAGMFGFLESLVPFFVIPLGVSISLGILGGLLRIATGK